MQSVKGFLCLALMAVVAATGGCNISQKVYDDEVSRRKDAETARDSLLSKNASLESTNLSLAEENADLKKQLAVATKSAVQDEQLKKLYDEMQVLAQGEKGVEWNPNTKVLRFTDVLFDLGKADLRKEGADAIQKVAAAVKAEKENVLVQIDGHTDNIPVARAETKAKFDDLWGLSAARALTVLRTLEKQGVPAKQLYFRGFAQFQPIAPNDTPQGRQSNRRVEIGFVTVPAATK